MSDYSQITFFTPKDSLSTGNPNKIIYGSDVDAEFSAISTAIATKADVDGDAIGAGTPATELSVDNLKLDANKIISTNTDGDIELEPNGAGVHCPATVARSHGPDVRGLIDKLWTAQIHWNSEEILKTLRSIIRCVCVCGNVCRRLT